ncbi:hypothetical protein [Rosenbergiella collisarenosi]|uniref:hypothetical protein n=1 Tax=Rosenbergiella collisarenosi TaxID=1544695 RepID=UPI001F4EFB9D|nr:hypothetical protein [Rosenbergiella collisarenosi]
MFCGAIMPDGISPYQKVYFTSDTDMVVGYLGQGSSVNFSAQWESPFENSSVGGVAGAISQYGQKLAGGAQVFTGQTSKTSFESRLVWGGQMPPEFTIVVDLMATVNAQIEVNAAITTLIQMSSPQLNNLTPMGRPPATVTLDVGRRLKLMDVVIKDVSFELDAPRTADGFYTHNKVTIQCSGDNMINKSDIPSLFI